jgi:hypothetical protein
MAALGSVARCGTRAAAGSAPTRRRAARRLSPDSKKAKHFRLGLRDTGYAEGAQRSLRMAVSERDYDQVLRLDRSGIKSAS